MADFVGDVIGSVGGIVGGLFGADKQSGAISDAAAQSAAAARYAADIQKQMFGKQIELQEPWRRAGENALNRMTDGLNYFTRPFDLSDFTTDPGYQFRLSEGMNALENSAAGRGNYFSGNTLKALTRYGQDYASNEYNNVFNRFTNQQDRSYNKLAGLAGTGQTAANSAGTAGANYANTVGNLAMNNAAIQGNAGIANANLTNSMYGGIGNALAYGLGGGGGSNMFNSLYSGLGGMGSGIGAGISSMFNSWSPFDYGGYNAVADFIDF